MDAPPIHIRRITERPEDQPRPNLTICDPRLSLSQMSSGWREAPNRASPRIPRATEVGSVVIDGRDDDEEDETED